MRGRGRDAAPPPKYPGIRTAVDGSAAVVEMETLAGEGAGTFPVLPATQMAEGWAAARAAGWTNVHGRSLLLFEPESAAAAAAVTAGMSLVGLRATSFSGGQGVAAMHESLYAAAGKRLTYVINLACRAMSKQALSVHAGHDDYHAVDDAGFFQVFAKNAQEVADLNLIAHRIAELSLNPGLCAQDGVLTSHVIETVRLPEQGLVREFLGDPADLIESPTPAQRMVYGERRRRIPELFDVDYPSMLGIVQGPDSYQQGVAAQRPFYFDHVGPLADRAFAEYAALTGRGYARAAGYRMEDAEWALLGQGSVVADAEALCDHLRAARRLRIGVVNITMFRPFPADLLTALLRGKRGVVVLERVDQPLAVDPPLLREIRAAMSKAVENGRVRRGTAPHPGLAACMADQVPDIYSACFGLGSRPLRAADLVAAVENMLEGGRRRRQFYLGIEFVREHTRLPKLQIWQERLLEHYPDLPDLALPAAAEVDLFPAGACSFRIHALGGWGASAVATDLALATAEAGGLHVKVRPAYGSERRGQPMSVSATLAAEAIRPNGEPGTLQVVILLDPSAIRRTEALTGLAEGGALVLQSSRPAGECWASLPAAAQREIGARRIRLFALDALAIAAEACPEASLRPAVACVAMAGAFLRVAPLPKVLLRDEAGVLSALETRFSRRLGADAATVAQGMRQALRRGLGEVQAVEVLPADLQVAVGAVPERPAALQGAKARPGVGHQGRFWEQVGYLYSVGQDGIADPFLAMGALPVATSTIRDMTAVRLEVPEFIPDKCTGCGQCWTQCPDSAIPGLVTSVEDVLQAAMRVAGAERPTDRLRQIARALAAEARRLLKDGPFTTFGDVLGRAYAAVAGKLNLADERRAALDAEYAAVEAVLADFPLARTAPFFNLAESRSPGGGGLLSVTVSPEACKGCNLCIEVCPEGALVAVPQTEDIVARLRRHWRLWQELPETDDRYVNLGSLDEGIGVLPSLLLKKENYLSMAGGDGACVGCGEKTVLHLVLAAIHGFMLPRGRAHVARLDELIGGLERKARELLASDADLLHVEQGAGGTVALPLETGKKSHVDRISGILRDLRDLRWRYTEGPGGHGRAACGMINATGCSAAWASTYPFNPYPFPWVSHLFQDSPSMAVGIFEGHMRKMAQGFAAVRRAALELADEYEPAAHDPALAGLDWRDFTDEEFALCPPILAVGGDGAILDGGFQNLSRLLASGKPIRVIMLDTQTHTTSGGETCAADFPGQEGSRARWGAGPLSEPETRKELALLAMAHRNVFVLQSSQAAPAHLMAGVLKGLQARRPAVFSLHSPCPPGHGTTAEMAPRSARLALESRAFPLLVYDPTAGGGRGDRLSLDGNPAADAAWASYECAWVDEVGAEQVMTLPLTVADWAATEGRFRHHFTPVAAEEAEEGLAVFHEYLTLARAEREGKTPFIWVLDRDRRRGRLAVSPDIVRLGEDRQQVWALLREMQAGKTPEAAAVETEFARRLEALRTEYEAKLADLRLRYPQVIARRLAERILQGTDGGALAKAIGKGRPLPDLPGASDGSVAVSPRTAPAPAAAAAAPSSATASATEPAAAGLALEPYIDTALCTACNECTNLNKRMFAYNSKKQAYIKDVKAGPFKDLVVAAEKCPVRIIHPGTPLDPTEKDLGKWIERAKPFN